MPGSNGFIIDPLNDDSMPWARTLLYTRTFEEEIDWVSNELVRCSTLSKSDLPDLSKVEACVVIKNRDRAIVFANEAFRRFFSGGKEVLGRNEESLTIWRNAKMNGQIDDMILDGMQFVDCEHVGGDADGRSYTFRTYKSAIEDLQLPDFHILGISRPIAFLGTSSTEQKSRLADLHGLFISMDSIDQKICRLDAMGEMTKDISRSVGLTSRSIENRRKKMQELFHVERTMEVIRITIRLEEHGLLPPTDPNS
jgi:hypothetical protein